MPTTPDWQPHIRNKKGRKLATRFKDPKRPVPIVIVRDMWLTGFDVPCLHTMYVDKPMRGHGLMQAIARVNRVFRDKPGGLVVDYLGLADQLKQAWPPTRRVVARAAPSIDTAQAIAVMLEKYEVACDMLHGFKWRQVVQPASQQNLGLLPAGSGTCAGAGGREATLYPGGCRPFACLRPLCRASDEAIRIRDDVSFFQAIKAALVNPSG